MKNFTSTLAVASLLTLAGSAFSAENPDAERFNKHIRSLNAASLKNHAEKNSLHGVSVETGVPEEKLLEIHKNHPKIGPAGIFVACIIADHTKKDPEIYVKQTLAGRPWSVIAQENKVPLEQIEERLARIETYVNVGGDQKPAASGKKAASPQSAAPQPTAPR